MERIVLFLVLGAFLTGSIYSINVESNTLDADTALSDYQYQELSREAALAGLRTTVRKLAQTSGSPWSAPGTHSTSATAHRGGGYTATVTGVGGTGDTVNVAVTGWYDADTTYIDARYERAFDTQGIPPAFRSVILTNTLLQISGNITISTLDPNVNANIHTNGTLTTNGNAFLVEGYGTYSDPNGGNTTQVDNFVPSRDYNGAESNVLQIPPIQIPNAEMDASDPDVHYVHPIDDLNLTYANSNLHTINIADKVYNSVDGLCTVGAIPASKCFGPNGEAWLGDTKAFVWYFRGNITLQNVDIVGNVVMYADGYRTGSIETNNAVVPGFISLDRTVRGSIDNNQTQLMFRTPGTIDIYGNDQITGSFWANGQVTFHGTPDFTGNILSPDSQFRGNGDFTLTYAAPSSLITSPGYQNVSPIGPVLIGYGEWNANTLP